MKDEEELKEEIMSILKLWWTGCRENMAGCTGF